MSFDNFYEPMTDEEIKPIDVTKLPNYANLCLAAKLGYFPARIILGDVAPAEEIPDGYAWKRYTDRLTKKQNVRFAILCAKSVIANFEEQHPDDERPRDAIEAAQNWLANPSEENRIAARNAADAAYAAYAAAYAASAAYAAAAYAASAAYAADAYAAANAAANAAAYAADAYAADAYAANAAAYAANAAYANAANAAYANAAYANARLAKNKEIASILGMIIVGD